MERKTTRDFGQGFVPVTEVGFRSSGENWNEYLTDDGTVIRVKLVATEILRLDDQFDAQGNPIYVVGSQNVIVISAPEERRQGNER